MKANANANARVLVSGRDGPRSMGLDPPRLRWLHLFGKPGVSVSVVAHRNEVNANLVFNSRRRFRERADGVGGLVPVIVEPPPLDAVASDASAAGRMEIALADGSRVIVDREVDGSALARVLAVLARR